MICDICENHVLPLHAYESDGIGHACKECFPHCLSAAIQLADTDGIEDRVMHGKRNGSIRTNRKEQE